jgi:hypothetical protein
MQRASARQSRKTGIRRCLNTSPKREFVSRADHPVVGETPNLAARLQALAEPDAVVIAAGTRRLLGDLFECRDLGAVEVKGIAAPVPAWQVLRASGVASRFEALARIGVDPHRVPRYLQFTKHQRTVYNPNGKGVVAWLQNSGLRRRSGRFS